MVKMFISNDNKLENRDETLVDSYNALDHIKDLMQNVNMDISFSSFIEEILPELDSFIGALKAIKAIKDEKGRNPINEALKRID